MISRKYRNKLLNYVKWDCGDGMGVFEFEQDDNALTAEEIMLNWESNGIDFPKKCKNPEDLIKYIRGKKWMDWHITEWTVGLNERILFPHELKGTLGLSDSELKQLAENTYDTTENSILEKGKQE